MATGIHKWLIKKYPQNYIIRKPLAGVLIFLVFCIFFVVIYKPLDVKESRYFGYEMTVAIYCIILAIPLIGLVRILKSIRFFSNSGEWTILKEIIAVAVSLLGMGVIVYFLGFLLETPNQRWNLSTFLDSLRSAFLIGVIPFAFFTIINYRYLFVTDIIKNFNAITSASSEQSEELIRVVSQLKKEELSFYPSQLVYAESDGNYVIFYLTIDNQLRKKIIRNSIGNIDRQLSAIPFLIRTHRAFIVNLKRVVSQKGNSLGYRLKLSGIDTEIPVSRPHTHDFNSRMKRYH